MNRSRTEAGYTKAWLPAVVNAFEAQKLGRLAQLFFDAQQLVIFGDAIGARGGAGLDLSGTGADGKVGDKGVFGLAGAVRDDRGKAEAPSPR